MPLLDAAGNPLESAPDAKVIDPNEARRTRPDIRVAISVPTQDHVAAGFAFDLAGLVGATATHRRDIEMRVHFNKGTLLPSQREDLVRQAIDLDMTHILWLDSDMRFPKNLLHKLLLHQQPIVALNYTTRRLPVAPVAVPLDETAGERLFLEPGQTGLVPVFSVGMGAMLVDLDVYKALPEPWFILGYSPDSGKFQSEDVYFCLQARQAGLDVLVDVGLSQEVSHIGEWEYRHEHALAFREAGQDAAPPDGI